MMNELIAAFAAANADAGMIDFAARTLFWFFVYAGIGWCLEVVYAAIKEHRLVNRGFLCGPVCPIYGCGMVGLVTCVRLLPKPADGSETSAVLIFFTGMILATLVELIGGWALFKLYHIRWWDYSHLKWNIGGYVCPQFSLLWGLGSVLMVRVVHPALTNAGSALPLRAVVLLDVIFLLLFAVDLAVSSAAAVGLNKRLQEIDELRSALRVTSDKLTALLGTSAMTADTLLDEQKLQLTLAAMEGRDNASELKDEVSRRADALRGKLNALHLDTLGTRRLLRAFPEMKSLRYADTLAATRRAAQILSAKAKQAAENARTTAGSVAEKLKK